METINGIEYKMVAPDIDCLIRCFYNRNLNPKLSTPALLNGVKPLFEALEPLKPYSKNEEVKVIWLRIPRGTIEDYYSFEDLKMYGEVETYEDYVEMWECDYPEEFVWYELVVVWSEDKEGQLRYYGMSLGNKRIISATLEEKTMTSKEFYCEEEAICLCKLILPAVEQSMKLLREGVYNDFVEKNLPYQFRTGVIKRYEIWKEDKEHKEWCEDGLSQEEIDKFVEIVESGENSKERIGRIKEFTANDFFGACKLGYEAIGKECKGYTLPELYMHYADGRDEGLTGKGHGLNAGIGIDFASPREWDEWFFNRKQQGGHPWEVVPGGNSTHMELYVQNDRDMLDWQLRLGEISDKEYRERIKRAGYYFAIAGTQRQFETVNFYLTLRDANLPVFVYDAEELVARFKGTDYVGIVPHHTITRYCANLFPEKYGSIIDFTHVYRDEDKWFDKIDWLPEEPAELI